MHTYEELRTDRSLSPYRGPDKLGATLKCGTAGGELDRWTYTAPAKLRPWKIGRKATKTQADHVELSQREFRSIEGYRFTFWALAPVQPGIRSKWQNNMHCEFVWLILDGTNGRGIHIALVDPDTSEVRWWRSNADHWSPADAERLALQPA
jgi:hypothetical protein